MSDVAVNDRTALVDRDRLIREYGLGPRGADRIFRAVPNVCLPGYRRVFVWRSDVDEYLREYTLTKTDVKGA